MVGYHQIALVHGHNHVDEKQCMATTQKSLKIGEGNRGLICPRSDSDVTNREYLSQTFLTLVNPWDFMLDPYMSFAT